MTRIATSTEIVDLQVSFTNLVHGFLVVSIESHFSHLYHIIIAVVELWLVYAPQPQVLTIDKDENQRGNRP